MARRNTFLGSAVGHKVAVNPTQFPRRIHPWLTANPAWVGPAAQSLVEMYRSAQPDVTTSAVHPPGEYPSRPLNRSDRRHGYDVRRQIKTRNARLATRSLFGSDRYRRLKVMKKTSPIFLKNTGVVRIRTLRTCGPNDPPE